jgi:probable F420-dependent oxidoreductase
VRLTLSIPSFGPFFPAGRLHEVIDLARRAEAAGVDTVIVPDHVVMGEHTENYEWGAFPFPIDVPWLEPLTVLAAISGATSRVRLATGILIAPLRPAIVLAKTAATLDVLSRGRLELGVGVGWQREEFDAAGLDFGSRAQRLDDTIGACRVLWRDSPASFASKTVSFEKIWCEPRPVQPGGVPVWFSGTLHARNVERIVRWGDGWIPIMTATRTDLADGAKRLADEFARAGRDPRALKVRGSLAPVIGANGRPDLAATLAGADALAAAGATDAQLGLLAFVRKPEQQEAFFAELAERWRQVSRSEPQASEDQQQVSRSEPQASEGHQGGR